MAALAFYKRCSSGTLIDFECMVIKLDAASLRGQPTGLCSKMLSVQNVLPFCSKMCILFVLKHIYLKVLLKALPIGTPPASLCL